MRRKWVIFVFYFISIFYPASSRGEDSTLLLTFKTEVHQTAFKNDLRLGIWKNGKDDLDPLDMEAMLNGVVDAYFEIPAVDGGPDRFLWWDIRSDNPLQVWKLHLKTSSPSTVVMEWRRVPFQEGQESVTYLLVDPETGSETDLSQGSGAVTFPVSGKKSLIIKSRQR